MGKITSLREVQERGFILTNKTKFGTFLIKINPGTIIEQGTN